MAPTVMFCFLVITISDEIGKVALVHNPVAINANKLHRVKYVQCNLSIYEIYR